MPYEAVIGLEVHAQLQTRSKMFCGCATEFGRPANTQTCPVCLGMPGALPVINQKAVELAAKAGLALNCHIRPQNRFARKHYFYPDLPKGYQISQYEAPICEHGWIDVTVDGASKRVRIRRAHLEEDAGKNIHEGGTGSSQVDLSRAGIPLLEIVTEPDMRSPDEVVAYLKTLRDILVYLGVCDGNMEQGSLRCEPNLSLRPAGEERLGTKVELKNINSFKFVKDALEYEIARQTKVLNEGGGIEQETRLWDVEHSRTAVMRSKEDAHDYRYFQDPDLLPVSLQEKQVEEWRDALPELPAVRLQRFVTDYQLPAYDAGVLTSSRPLADYFEACVRLYDQPKSVSHWVMGELLRELHASGTPVEASPMSPERLVGLLKLVDDGTISLKVARDLFFELYGSGKEPQDLVQERGLTQVSDDATLGAIIADVIDKNPAQVAQYRDGKTAVLGFFVGQVMKATGGKANPGKVNELLSKKLTGA